MKIIYKFADETVSEVEVSEEIGNFILDSRRKESNSNRRHQRYCWSLDAITYEGDEYGITDTYEFETELEKSKKIINALNHLTAAQKRRLLLYAQGKTLREIAKLEDSTFQSVDESIKAAKKKFLQYF